MGDGALWPMIAVVLFLVIMGLLFFTGKLSRVGRLPGDINYTGKRTKVFIPITSMLILSLLLSLILSLLSWLW